MAKILIIEDEKVLLKALVTKFTAEGFDVITAKDGKAGLDKAIDEKPDIMLVDIILPEMDGVTMLENLRKDEWGKTAKAIILTNLADEAKLEEARSNNVNDYLIKSDWKLEDVVKRVREKLE